MIRDSLIVAGKDLRVEWRSRVLVNQVAPFTLLVVVLFGFALATTPGHVVIEAESLSRLEAQLEAASRPPLADGERDELERLVPELDDAVLDPAQWPEGR